MWRFCLLGALAWSYPVEELSENFDSSKVERSQTFTPRFEVFPNPPDINDFLGDLDTLVEEEHQALAKLTERVPLENLNEETTSPFVANDLVQAGFGEEETLPLDETWVSDEELQYLINLLTGSVLGTDDELQRPLGQAQIRALIDIFAGDAAGLDPENLEGISLAELQQFLGFKDGPPPPEERPTDISNITGVTDVPTEEGTPADPETIRELIDIFSGDTTEGSGEEEQSSSTVEPPEEGSEQDLEEARQIINIFGGDTGQEEGTTPLPSPEEPETEAPFTQPTPPTGSGVSTERAPTDRPRPQEGTKVILNLGRGLCRGAEPIKGIQPSCDWDRIPGQQLKIWPENLGVSICEALVDTVEECETLCEVTSECEAVHFCESCVDHNCRLLREKVGGPTGLELFQGFEFVNYCEKLTCP